MLTWLRDALSRSAMRFALAALGFGLAIYVSHRVGIPHDSKGRADLPDAALDWRLLFHVERAAALIATAGAVLLIAWNGVHGDWPRKFANVEFAPKETPQITALALRKVEQTHDLLARQTAQHFLDVDARLRAVEGSGGIDSSD